VGSSFYVMFSWGGIRISYALVLGGTNFDSRTGSFSPRFHLHSIKRFNFCGGESKICCGSSVHQLAHNFCLRTEAERVVRRASERHIYSNFFE